MPRDLTHEELQPVQLTESPNTTDLSKDQSAVWRSADDDNSDRFIIIDRDDYKQTGRKPSKYEGIHPYTRPLTVSDLESCIALENASFPEAERCTREKFIYRLNKCGELCLGLFCSAPPDSDISAETLKTGHPVETGRRTGDINVLLAYVIATKTAKDVVSDESMDYPRDWEKPDANPGITGHQEDGRTICVHSLAVLPSFRGKGLGRTIMTAYMQQMNGAGIADRIALIAHDRIVEYYEKLGFANKGPSKVLFGGAGWTDLIYLLKPVEPRTMYG